ncbi:MAG: hypothetical protein ACYC8T_36860 [Myxococcaceae bacterium]
MWVEFFAPEGRLPYRPRMLARPAVLAVFSTLAASAAFGEGLADKKETFGAVVAPAAMPTGSNAIYAYVGAPEVGAGYRQGVEGLELEARASFDYLALALAAEVIVRLPLLREGFVELAPTLGVGVIYSSGARYYYPFMPQFAGIRPRAGLVCSLKLNEIVRGIVSVDVPWALGLTSSAMRVTPLAGGGAEIYVSPDMSVLVLGQIGVDVIKEPLGLVQTRPGWKVQLGLGFRLF